MSWTLNVHDSSFVGCRWCFRVLTQPIVHPVFLLCPWSENTVTGRLFEPPQANSQLSRTFFFRQFGRPIGQATLLLRLLFSSPIIHIMLESTCVCDVARQAVRDLLLVAVLLLKTLRLRFEARAGQHQMFSCNSSDGYVTKPGDRFSINSSVRLCATYC